MACAHNQVTPNALRGVKPGHWPIGGGLYHFDGLCEECKKACGVTLETTRMRARNPGN